MIILRLILVSHILLNYFGISKAESRAFGFNAFYKQKIRANVTCGSPAEQYFNTTEGYISPRERQLSLCDSVNPLYARPPSLMLDGDLYTSWQSRNNIDMAYITIDIDKPVFGKQMIFNFGYYRRPGQIAIFKSSDFGKTYHPWHYMVSLREQCTSVFGIPESEIYVLPDQNTNRVLCQEYKGYPFEFNEEVMIDLNGDLRGDGSDTYESPELLRWMNTTNVHIRFSGLYRKFDYIDTRWHHYSVSEISLISRCDCNGHGDGLSCPVDSVTGLRTCICSDNTCGANCEKCCPAFNQYPWERGTQSAWSSDNTTSCQPCNCFGHSNSCRYSRDVANSRLSLNNDGEYYGGGVCENCQHNTMGINCEKCKPFYYRLSNVPPDSPNICLACGCSIEGSQPGNSMLKFAECITDSSMMSLYAGKNVGDCFCKANVIGAKCATCKDQFYRLEQSNPLGCRPCACNLDGTVQRFNLCHKDFFGQCPCKSNVKLRDCTRCKDGYYDLRNDDINGCKWCDCDAGASLSPYICDKVTGVCSCRAHTTGRQCKEVEQGYFFPDLYYIQGVRDLYTNPQSSLQTTLVIPQDSLYYLRVGYTLSSNVQVKLFIELKKFSTKEVVFGIKPYADINLCSDKECYGTFFANESSQVYNLQAGTYDVAITSSFTSTFLLLERVVAIPAEFITADVLFENDRKLYLQNCGDNNLRFGTTDEAKCLAAVYSMTIKFEDGALPCGCNSVGSVSNICNKYGGNCQCKSGVGGRDCSYCLPGFYGFSRAGCTACNCKGTDKICNSISGICNCPPNTRGRTCEPCACNGNSNQCTRDGICLNCQFNSMGNSCQFCKSGFYGNALINQCLGCNCHIFGSYNASCDMVTGQCYCKPGVVGQTCSKCAPNYFGLSPSGCSPCNCNAFGSSEQQCNNAGQCSCFTDVQGLKCDRCKVGYFGLPAKPCSPCECHLVGTILNTNCVNDVSGQCSCKPGVEGRDCSQCQKQYSDFGINGCKQCPLCTRKLQLYVDSVDNQLEDLEEQLELTQNLTDLQSELKLTQAKKQQVELNAIYFENRLLQGQKDFAVLHNDKLIPWNMRLTDLLNEINNVQTQVIKMRQMTFESSERMTSIYNAAVQGDKMSKESDSFASAVFSYLVYLNSLASDFVSKAYSYSQNVPTFNLESFEKIIDRDLKLSNDLLTNITIMAKDVARHQTLARIFFLNFDQIVLFFQNKQDQWSASLGNFIEQITNIYNKGKQIEMLMNQTQSLLNTQKDFIFSTVTEQSNISQYLSQTDALFQQAYSVYEKTFMQTQRITGSIEVMFMQYNPQNSMVRVNVLRGYQLVARDYPSMTSNPFFTLKISPSWWDQGTLESAPKQATLDPIWDWPVGGTYTFFITSEQMKLTKLIITVLDYDEDGNNDFMGEVVIDLAIILPIISQSSVQNTYTLNPQGYASRWLDTFPGPGDNSILDLQDMLKSQITTVTDNLNDLSKLQTLADAQANKLQKQAQDLSNTFDLAKQYASKAVNAVNAYNQIYQLINSSLLAAASASSSVQAFTLLLNGISISTFTSKTDTELLAAQQFLSQTRSRNISKAVLQIDLRSETFGSSGVNVPPRSSILINRVEYHPNINGHTVMVLSYVSGSVLGIKTFRTDINQNAGAEFLNYLINIPPDVIVIIVKQGEGSIASFYQASVITQLIGLGGQVPYFSGNRGSYVLLGYKKTNTDTFPWVSQDLKAERLGVSKISKLVYLKSTLNDLIEMANKTFLAALPQWDEINSLFPTLKLKTSELAAESSTAPLVQAALDSANVVISQSAVSASKIFQLTQNLLGSVDDLSQKFNYLASASTNVTNVIAEGQEIVMTAEYKLQFQQKNVGDALNIISSASYNSKIEQKQSELNFKLSQLNTIASKMPFTIKYMEGEQSSYKLTMVNSGYTEQRRFMTVSFDFIPFNNNGILWFLLSSPDSLAGSMGIYIKDGFLYFTYNLGRGAITEKIRDVRLGEWNYINVAMILKDVTVVFKDSYGLTTVIKMSSPYYNDKTYMTFDSYSMWYLNGFPDDVMDELTNKFGSMSAVYDNIFINDVYYNPWNTDMYTGVMSYANYRYKLVTTNGSYVTLFGTGYIKHNVGGFMVNRDYSSIKLEFRTLRDNVVIFGVVGVSGNFVYGLYIFGGRLMFSFATSLGNDIAVLSTRNIYNNGEWYVVQITRSGVNATLSVKPINPFYQVLAKSISEYLGPAVIPTGVNIIFGAPSKDSQIPPTVSGIFAGDMRNLMISGSSGDSLTNRQWNGDYLIEQKATSYYGQIDGLIVPGIRFYGYMWWEKSSSYAVLNSFLTEDIISIYMSFKTIQLNGLILYRPPAPSGYHFYIGLVAGNLFIAFTSVTNTYSYQPFVTKNKTLSDGQWHNTSVAYTPQGFQVQVDGEILYLGWFGNSLTPKLGMGSIYVGGIPTGVLVDLQLPTTASLAIDFYTILINRIEQNKFAVTSSGVSYAGITPGVNSPQPLPSCAASFPDYLFSPDPLPVQFGATPWYGYQTYIGFQLSEETLQKYFSSSFVITMTFKAMLPDGIMFYIADSETNPTQYVSLELIGGQLRYEFFNGNEKVSINTENMTSYSNDGKVYKVYLLRIYQFGAMLIPDTMEYKNARQSNAASIMTLKTPLYIGGLPNSINAPNFVKRKYGFSGCFQKFEISSGMETYPIDFTNPDLGGTPTGTLPCYSNTEPGVYFNGNDSWVLYDSTFQLEINFDIEMQFRTYERSGLLFYAYSKQTPQGVGGDYGAYALLELVDGKIVFRYKANLFKSGQSIEWSDKKVDTSFYLCDQKWHTVRLSKTGQDVTIEVDKIVVYGSLDTSNSGSINGVAYIGGVKNGIFKPGSFSRYFDGCLKITSLNKRTDDIHTSEDGNNIVFGCATF
ncbi:laminin subunit alpha-1 isoform X3 [Hydra vulgaris]|uniref:Laminin subunit alpha-1 isoform X3 n=1 Tax=Hydra vulgaris TaxID=6087 RepID=A0ABM4DAN7_HYDVU